MLLEMEFAPTGDLFAYQDACIKNIVQHAYDTVPYYKSIMKSRGLRPEDVTTRQDLVKLPLLTKEDIVENVNALQSTAFSRRDRLVRHTSGTTGKALTFFTTREAVAFQWALWWRHRMRFGIEPGMKHMNFTGKPVASPDQQSPPYWRWSWPLSQAVLGMQHIAESKIQSIVEFINAESFAYFSGYPSVLHAFSSMLLEQGLEIKAKPSCVFLGAEGVTEGQKSDIESATGSIVTDQYGFSEGCGNASKCEHDIYHEDWEFGYLEMHEPESLPDGSRRGRIVATGFSNRAFPFIRYDVGDVGLWSGKDYECACGRHSPTLFRIEGRCEDYILTPEGTRIMRFDYIFKDTKGIREAQVVQRAIGQIIVRIVPRREYSQKDERIIRTMVRDWISPTLNIEIELVDGIPRSSSGKFRPVLSELGGASDE